MINFVNNGTDEAILKSLPVDDCSEDLIKAMNKQGLVQKEVTVQGKNGKTFTRKQWVKASEASSGTAGKSTVNSQIDDKTDKPSHKSLDDLRKMSDAELKKFLDEAPAGTKITGIYHNRSGMEAVVEKHEGYKAIYGGIGAGSRIKESNWRIGGSDDHYIVSTIKGILSGTNKYYKASPDDNNSQKKDHSKDSFTDFLDWSKTDTRAAYLLDRIEEASGDPDGMSEDETREHWAEALKKYCGYDLTSKKSNDIKPPQKGYVVELTTVKGAYMYVYAEKPTLSSAVEAYNKAGGNLDTKQVREFKKRSNKVALDSGIVKNYCVNIQNGEYSLYKPVTTKTGASDTSKKPENMTDSELDMAIRSKSEELSKLSKEMNSNAKQQGQLNSSATKEQKQRYDKLVDEIGDLNVEKGKRQRVAKTSAPQSASITSQPTSGQKLSKADAKAKTQSYTSKVGKTEAERSAFMDKVKAAGITWKENDKAGINWMRCCMAMNAHFENGGTFDDTSVTPKADTSSSSSVPKTLKDVGIDYGYTPSESERKELLKGQGSKEVQKKVEAYVKQAALDYDDPNIKPNVSFIMEDVIQVGLGMDMKNYKNPYDLSRSDGAAFKKQIESHLSDMHFTVEKTGKSHKDGQTSYWFRLANG